MRRAILLGLALTALPYALSAQSVDQQIAAGRVGRSGQP